MKKLHVLFALLTFGLFISCSKDNKEGEGSSSIQSITITANPSEAYVGDNIQFTVKGNNNVDVTGTAVIHVNSSPIVNNFFTPTAAGTLSVYAVYQVSSTVSITSPTIQIPVIQGINFNKRVLIEDYTGTWCQFCPRVSYAISQVRVQTSDAVVVAIHRGSDPYNFSAASVLESMIGLTGYPTAMLNRKTDWTYPENNNVTQVVNLTNGTNPRIGLAMTNSVNSANGNVTVQVNVKFGKNFSGLKLVVYALEDNLLYNQTNSTSFYGGVNPIVSFNHKDVLRAFLTTSILGDDITGATTLNGVYTRSFTYNLGGAQASNIHFAAFVVDSAGNALNSRDALTNETQTFEVQ
jgi:FlaG/FlaF family flagellin (archaellin)